MTNLVIYKKNMKTTQNKAAGLVEKLIGEDKLSEGRCGKKTESMSGIGLIVHVLVIDGLVVEVSKSLDSISDFIGEHLGLEGDELAETMQKLQDDDDSGVNISGADVTLFSTPVSD